MFRNDLIQGVRDSIGRMNVQHDAVKLETADPVMLPEITRLACAHPALLVPAGIRGPFAVVVAMLAVAETIKSLLAVAPQPSRLIEFSGYESRSHELGAAPGANCRICG